MKTRMLLRNQNWLNSIALVLVILCCSLPALSQGTTGSNTQALTLEQFAGKYKGSAKSPARDLVLTLEIKADGGKLSGRLSESTNEHTIVSGEIAGNKLVLNLQGKTGAERLTIETREGKLTGEWVINSGEWAATGGKPGPIQFEKSIEDVLSGEWDAVADAQGQPFPFLLTLKVDGEKVTGSSSSQLGTSPISSGTWKDGKLAIVLEGSAGQIAMGATMIEGKLSGEFDFAGQLSGKWVAIKKK